MKQSDSLGRATFHSIKPKANIRPTEREIRWFKHIERHGPQASTYLYELTKHTHRCRDTALRSLQKLRAGGYLFLPKQQRATEHADFNPYIYDLTAQARAYLVECDLAEATVRPTGHWWHGYMTSCITSAIDMAAAQKGYRYIPAHEILAIKNASLGVPMGRSKLIPDQLFAIDYGGSFRAFMLEVDRGTEPFQSNAARKSLKRSVEQYGKLISQDLYKQHYGLKANILVLWAFTSKVRQMKFFEECKDNKALDERLLISILFDPQQFFEPDLISCCDFENTERHKLTIVGPECQQR